jgi:hypothetical protein
MTFSACTGAISRAYQPSDWAFAWILCEVLNEGLTARRPSGMLNASTIANALSGLARPGVTEGDRRRMGVQLEHRKDCRSRLLQEDAQSRLPGIAHAFPVTPTRNNAGSQASLGRLLLEAERARAFAVPMPFGTSGDERSRVAARA